MCYLLIGLGNIDSRKNDEILTFDFHCASMKCIFSVNNLVAVLCC